MGRSHKLMMKSLKNKQGSLAKFKKHNVPKKTTPGWGKSECRRCGKVGMGMINKYGLGYCRHCFREVAAKLGFKKYS